MLAKNFDQFVIELDAAMQAHMDWSRRVFRCAVLHTAPGDDAMKEEAHTLCGFGRWLGQHRACLEAIDADRTRALEAEHRTMHDAVRAICSRILQGKPGETADLDLFEAKQYLLVDHVAHFKTLAITRSSQVDALTGLSLRNHMEQDFALLGKHCRRHGSVPMLMMADVDQFKAINDQHGHAAGDAVLQQLAVILKRAIRDNDFVYRYGGDEFVLLLELAEVQGAPIAAQRVLDAVRTVSVVLPDEGIVYPTVTIGAALAADSHSLAGAIQRADTALYAAKAAGRNCYVVGPTG